MSLCKNNPFPLSESDHGCESNVHFSEVLTSLKSSIENNDTHLLGTSLSCLHSLNGKEP